MAGLWDRTKRFSHGSVGTAREDIHQLKDKADSRTAVRHSSRVMSCR